MPTERNPPNYGLAAGNNPERNHQFGKPSTIQSKSTQPQSSKSNVPSKLPFIIPKPGQVRREHHRSEAPPHRDNEKMLAYRSPDKPLDDDDDDEVVEIARPKNVPFSAVRPVPKPIYMSLPAGGAPSNASNNVIDLTATNRKLDHFDPFRAIDSEAGGAYGFMDPEKATESIKALLEGNFEDDEDKIIRYTRSRKHKIEEKVNDAFEKLKDLTLGTHRKSDSGAAKKAEDEEVVKGESDGEEQEDGTIEGLEVKLLPHQVVGVRWMISKESGPRSEKGVLPKGGILADDMGLGKTLQSIAVILSNPHVASEKGSDPTVKIPADVQKSTLVVAPLALIKQWEKEIKDRVSPSHRLRVCVHHGPQRTKRSEDLQKFDVVITTYQILVSEFTNSSSITGSALKVGCFGIHWHRVILDEAHTIKNRNAKSTQACYALRSEYRWCLTGTPMQNNLDELQSLIKFLRIKPYNELAVWKEQITRPMKEGRGDTAIKRLQYYLKAFMKRRTKEVLKKEGALNAGGKADGIGTNTAQFKVTERKVQEVIVDFSEEERGFYERLQNRTDESLKKMMSGSQMSYANALVLLLRLRQACNHPQLVGGQLSKDTDALASTRGAAGLNTPKKSGLTADVGLDDITNAIGGLSVQTRQCEVCMADLSKAEIGRSQIRCGSCQDDLDQLGAKKEKRSHKKSKAKTAKKPQREAKRAIRHRPRITDSDDEEEAQDATRRDVTSKQRSSKGLDSDSEDEEVEGEWIVPVSQRKSDALGRAGGSDDENAEGGGEWLSSDDTDTSEESDLKVVRKHRSGARDVISLNTTEDEDSVESEEETEESSETETESEDGIGQDDGYTAAAMLNSTKIRHLIKILNQESHQHKFIVFSQFTSMLDLIEPFLTREGLIYTRYDGSMRNDAREASLERLRNHKKTRILLCSLKCGSLGLNLTAASRVVILEPFWNPFVEEQAIDRVHRLNQTIDVVVYKITVKDTVEERILHLQEKKRQLADAAIEGKAIGNLSMKDIMQLFRHDHGSGAAELNYFTAAGGSSSQTNKSPAKVAPRNQAGASTAPGLLPRGQMGPSMGQRVPSGGHTENSLYGRRWS
ncbi:MAG: hypothetical protein M1825_001946 [Sarcosagium campestre]|nr:MAG: hypothetical protein M1825_001946 [Sarcosagium campestre]